MQSAQLSIEQQIEMCDSYRSGALVNDLRDRYDLTYKEFDSILKSHNVPRRKMGVSRRILGPEIEREIEVEYKGGSSMRALASKYRVDRSVISRIIHSSGINLHSLEFTNQKKVLDRDLICSEYESGKSIGILSRELEVSTATVSRILRKKGVKIRDTGPTHRKKTRFTEKEIEQMIRLYRDEKISICGILKRFESKTGHSNLSKLLKSRGVKIRNSSEQNTRYACNHNIFLNPNSPESYYLLGWLYTDGTIRENPKHLISIELHEEDECIVKYFRDSLCPTKPIYSTSKKTRIFATNNKTIFLDLKSLGLHQNKSLTLAFPSWLRDDLFPHFMRGVFEGDGYFTFGKSGHFTLGFCGSSPFTVSLAEYIKNRFGIHLNHVFVMRNHRYIISSMVNSLRFSAMIYENANMICPRKFLVFSRAFEKNKNSKRLDDSTREYCKRVIVDCKNRFAHLLS